MLQTVIVSCRGARSEIAGAAAGAAGRGPAQRVGSGTACCRAGLLLALVLAACAAPQVTGQVVTIGQIQAHPREHVGRTAVIEGEVTGTMSLVLARYFTLDDGTGTINVVTGGVLPRKGEWLRVAGRVSDVLSLGSESTLILIEDEAGHPPDGGGVLRSGAQAARH